MKKLFTGFIFCLFVLSLSVVSANAATPDPIEGTDYYSESGEQVILDLSFDGEGTWGDKNGIYAPNMSEADGKLVYTGAADYTQFMCVKPNDEFKKAYLTVDVVFELEGVSQVLLTARQGYNTNAYPDILREPGIQNITYDENGKVTSVAPRNGWLGANDDKSKDSYTVTEEGYVHMHFVVHTSDAGLVEITFQFVGVDATNATIKLDSLKIAKGALETVQTWDFDGEGNWGDKNGIYAPSMNEVDGALVYTGAADYTFMMCVKPNEAFKNAILYVDALFELEGVTQLFMTAREGYNTNAYPDILREPGVQNVAYDENGKITSVVSRNGWLGGNDDKLRDSYTVTEDGKLRMQYVIVTGELGLVEITHQVCGSDPANATVKLHSLSISKVVDATTTYYTYGWDTGFDEVDATLPLSPNEEEGGSVSWETENPLDGTRSVKVSGSATNDPVWGMRVAGFNGLIKSTGLHYIQMDIDSADFEWYKIWTNGDDYYEITFSRNDGWSTMGKVQNFKAEDLGHCYRISYAVNYTDANTPHYINVFNGEGSILMDNLQVVYVDDAPFVANGEYNLVDTADVALKYALKKASTATLLYADGSAVDASLYSMSEDLLTLSKDLFADKEASYTFGLESEYGVRTFTVSQKDNRPVVTVTVSEVSKVYDGTTEVKSTVTYTLSGVAEGADVVFTCELAYASANAGDDVALVVTNAALTGADADKYILSSDIELTGKITQKTITVVADSKTKVEGEADPQLTYTVEGLVGEDTLSGALARAEGETAGKYEITIGTLSASANYKVEFTKGELEITAKQSTEPGDQPTEPGDQPTEPAPSKGCLGSVVTSLFGLTVLAGAVAVLRKRKDNE